MWHNCCRTLKALKIALRPVEHAPVCSTSGTGCAHYVEPAPVCSTSGTFCAHEVEPVPVCGTNGTRVHIDQDHTWNSLEGTCRARAERV